MDSPENRTDRQAKAKASILLDPEMLARLAYVRTVLEREFEYTITFTHSELIRRCIDIAYLHLVERANAG